MRLKRSNKSLLGILLFCIASAGLALAQGAATQKQSQEALLRRLAADYERMGRYDLAATHYIQLCQLNNQDISNYLSAKRCLLRLKDYDRLTSLILNLQQTRRELRFEVDLAEIDYAKGETEKALKHWQEILASNSRSHEAYALIGASLIENRLFDEAIEVYGKARKAFKDQGLFIFELANLYTARGEFDLVTQEYLNYLKQNPTQTYFIESRLTAVATTSDVVEAMSKTLNEALKENPKLARAIHQLLGAIYTVDQNYEKALFHYVQLEALPVDENDKNVKSAQGQLLYNFATTAASDGAFDFARQAYQLLLTKYSVSPLALQAEVGLARVFEQQEQYPRAVEAYEKFIALHPQSSEAIRAAMRVGDIWFDHQFDLEKAKQAFERVLKNYPSSSFRVSALFRLGDCAVAGGSLAEAKQIYERVVAESRNGKAERLNEALLALAKLQLYQEQPTQALKYLDELLGQNKPGQTSRPDESENDALELLLLVRENKRDSVGLGVYGKARLAEFQRKHADCQEQVESYLAKNPNSALSDELRLLLADAYRKTNQAALALQTLNGLVENPKSLFQDLALKRIAQIYDEDLKDHRNAQVSYETLLEKFPQSIYIEEARQRIREIDKLN